MTEMPNDLSSPPRSFFGADVMRTLRRYQRQILLGAAVVTALALFGGGAWYAVLQPARRTVAMQFTLSFEGPVYPNGLKFSANDIVAPSVIDEVYRTNTINTYCDVELFRSGFFVDEKSLAIEVLDDEIRQRLSEPRVTTVERERVMAEYRQRRATLPVEHRLTFVIPEKCAAIPDTVALKALSDVLLTWANQSESRRGVLRVQVYAMKPSILTSTAGKDAMLLVRSDLLRRALVDTLNNIEAVGSLPGAGFVQMPDTGRSFRQIAVEIESLLRARVEPLVAASVAVSPDATNWLRDALEGAESRKASNIAREQAYLQALREYSGTRGADSNRTGQSRGRPDSGGADVGTLAPQIDSTFIDRIIEMAGTSEAYRQTLTDNLVGAGVSVAAGDLDVRYYKWLLASRRSGQSDAELEKTLQALTEAARALIVEFNTLYDHYTSVSLRPDAEMYTIASAPTSDRLIGFTRRSYLLLVASALFGSLVLGALAALAYNRRNPA